MQQDFQNEENPITPQEDGKNSAAITGSAAFQNVAIKGKFKAVGFVKMAPDVLKAMSHAAQRAGRTASDVWGEAAREWLLKKSLEIDYDVLSNQPDRRKESAPLTAMRTRVWGSIDTLMADIRETPSAVA